tara:strand:+ start:835 stop:996 length:162 start_codon:yes stop_codon:yes gene_type:complete
MGYLCNRGNMAQEHTVKGLKTPFKEFDLAFLYNLIMGKLSELGYTGNTPINLI